MCMRACLVCATLFGFLIKFKRILIKIDAIDCQIPIHVTVHFVANKPCPFH